MDPTPVICPNCATPNLAAARFCNNCGQGLSTTCAGCGTVNPAGARFCHSCGTPFGAAVAAPQAPSPTAAAPGAVAELRLVSVLFADLVGFTTLAEGRDAEETRELLSRYFAIAQQVIGRHGGTVEKFIGDAVMAVWGAPTSHEDDAERAVRAALELVAEVPSLGDATHPVQARAGVLTGEAAVTLNATNQGMVAGDLVNTASRLQSAAAPGTVLVGEATMHAASASIAFEPAGEQALKGKAAPVAAWRAVSVVARRGGSGRSAMLEPPFVGRDDEFSLLKDLFEATVREGKSRLITVVGQGGMGKSRLAWEFEKYLDGWVADVYWHEGRSPSYGEGISYWALAEMVRRRCGIAETDDEATIRRRLGATLDEFVLDATERRWIEPRLAGLLGLADLPTEGREELFAAWRTFFERMAGVAPVIMVFTDLQWADQGMLDFVEDLLRWSRNSPIFVVALARPELVERRGDFGSSVRSMTRINLESLPVEVMRRLLEGLVPGLPPAVVRTMAERSDGIPLYAVETVRALLDRGLLAAAEGGGYRLTGDLGQLGVADTLQALIAARLDDNLPEDRALLLDASVLGQSFTVEAVAAVIGKPPGDLADSLERLVRRELLTVEADPRSPERGQYQFVQALVREVAYQNLAKADRRVRHLAAARYFEALGSEELAGILATHYVAAYQASRPGEEADTLAAQARVALQAAASRAAGLHSNRQAVAYLEQALLVTTDPAEQASLHLRATELGELVGDLDGALRHADQARALYRTLADSRGVLRAATWLGRHETSGRLERQAIKTLEEAIAEAEPIAESAEYASALSELSRGYMLTSRQAEAVTTADRAMELGGRHGLLGPVVEAMINRGTALLGLGRRVEGIGSLYGAIALADRRGLRSASIRARNNLIGSDEDLKVGMEQIQEMYDLSVRLGGSAWIHQSLMMGTTNSFFMGGWDEWMDRIAAIEEVEEPLPFYRGAFAFTRAVLAAFRGHDAEADAQFAVLNEVLGVLQSPMMEAAQLNAIAWGSFARGQWVEASRDALASAAQFDQAIEGGSLAGHAAAAGGLRDGLEGVITALDGFSDLTGKETILGQVGAALAAREGKWAEARAGYQRTMDQMASMSAWTEQALTALEWGEMGRGHDESAGAAAELAEKFFAERGAQVFVERYRAAFVPVSAAASPASAPAAPSAAKVPSA